MVSSATCSQTPSYEGASKSFRTGHLLRELQMVQLSAIRCNYIAILWVSLVSFAAITLCTASQHVFIVISLSTQSGIFWIYPRKITIRFPYGATLKLVIIFRPPPSVMDYTLCSVATQSNYESINILDGRGVRLTTDLHLVPRSKNEWSYTSTPPIRLHDVVLS
jgi:hypothetical protein